MADSILKFVDSFEHYGAVDVRTKWTQGFGTFGGVISGGRNGKGFQINAGGGIGRTLDNYYQRFIVAFAFKLTGETFGNQQLILINSTNTTLAVLRVNADATLSMFANTALAFTTTFSLHPNTWYFVEFKVTLSGSTNINADGELRIDGNVKGSGNADTGVNALGLLKPEAKANNISIFNASGNGNTIIDDVYMLANNGSIDYRGDLKVLAIYPDGDHSPNDWTPVGGSGGHFERVNETAPDDDGTYLESETVGQEENFDWEDVPGTVGTIKGYQYSVRARKDNEGSRAIQQTVSGGDPSSNIFLNDDYIYYVFPIDDEIDATAFNARQHGFIVVDIS